MRTARKQSATQLQKRPMQNGTPTRAPATRCEVRSGPGIAGHHDLESAAASRLRTRLRVGRAPLSALEFKWRLAKSPACPCDNATPETRDHFLHDCPWYAKDRRDCLATLRRHGMAATTRTLLGDTTGLTPTKQKVLVRTTAQFLARAWSERMRRRKPPDNAEPGDNAKPKSQPEPQLAEASTPPPPPSSARS